MPFDKIIKNQKKTNNIINNSYDIRFPHPVHIKNIIYGYGCTICELPPKICESAYNGNDCCCVCCDENTDYNPKKIYKNIDTLTTHYMTHNLTFDDKSITFIQSIILKNIKFK